MFNFNHLQEIFNIILRKFLELLQLQTQFLDEFFENKKKSKDEIN